MTNISVTIQAAPSITVTHPDTTVGGGVDFDINGVDMATLSAGSPKDQQVVDSADAQVGAKSGDDWQISDATVRNAETPTWSDTVKAEDTLTLDQIKVLDSDAVTELLANYKPQTEGVIITCTPCTPVASLGVSLSDDNPSLNDTITITATPTNITPPSYTFITPDTDGHYTLTTQAGNTLDWDVDVTGSWTVTVIATDGGEPADFACNEAAGETAGDPDALAFISAHNTETGLTMGATQQAAINGLVERLKGTGTTNGSDLWSDLVADGAGVWPLCPVDDSTANADAYKINLIDPTDFGTYSGFVGGDFTANGVIGGTGKTFRTGLLSSDFGQDDISLHFYNRTDTDSTTKADVGTAVTGISVFTKYNATKSIIRINEDGFPGFSTISDVLGLLSYNRVDSANVTNYVDGVLHVTETSGSETPDGLEICFHALGTSATNPSDRQLAAYVVAGGMTANEIQDLSEAIAWYQSNIITGGRNV